MANDDSLQALSLPKRPDRKIDRGNEVAAYFASQKEKKKRNYLKAMSFMLSRRPSNL